jgi:hypothetical protein
MRFARIYVNSTGCRAEGRTKIWEDMRTDLNTILTQEQTFQAFPAYLVDAKRARNVESPAYHS